jgi:hypothetical protein
MSQLEQRGIAEQAESPSGKSAIDNLSKEEKLLLIEYLAEDVLKEWPDSLITAQIVYHARYLRGVAGRKQGGA